MLKKRVEVLFDEGEYARLEGIARSQKRSVGSVVREAVEKYVVQPDAEERRKAWEWLLSQSEGPVGSPEEIKAIIVGSIDRGIKKSLETD